MTDVMHAGDPARFQELISPYERELRAHCYRMTGSLSDADDALQDALLRAWRSLDKFEGRSSLRTWLYRIATNACIDWLSKRRERTLPKELGDPGDPGAPPSGPVLEPIWLEPCPAAFWEPTPTGPEVKYSARESVAVAFLVALQALPPLQRAVLVLREVLGFPAAEVAELLESTVPAVNSALQRARATLEARRERLEAPGALAATDPATRDLLTRYVKAWETGDADLLVTLLREDAVLTMPPVPTWFRGRDAIGRFLGGLWPHMGAQRLVATEASGAPAFAAYQKAPGDDRFRAQSIHVLGFGSGRIATLDAFMNPHLFGEFGFQAELD